MTQVLVYLIVGAGAVAVALVFILTREAMMLDWAILGLPEVANDACLQIVMLPSTTSTGTVRGGGKIAHG